MPRDVISVGLITQGDFKFYSGTMDIDKIVSTCTSNPREEDPVAGFQRTLDEQRAESIAEYIRAGGTIPSSIILSAQARSNLLYSNKKRSLEFELSPNAFLILDGQHRVYGFHKLMQTVPEAKYRIPVVIYSDLSPVDEARLFIDINTLQRPVPKELLLDIKKLAERENDEEELLDLLFTYFETEAESVLLGKLSRFEKKKNKISKVTFYDSLKTIIREFDVSNPKRLYRIINAYLSAVQDLAIEDGYNLNDTVTKATVFKILIGHAKSVIALIVDNEPDNILMTSGYKKYLGRSVKGNFGKIANSSSYLKTVDELEKKLLRRNITI